MLALLLAALIDVQPAAAVSLKPLQTINVAASRTTYTRDEQYEYLATGGGLFRAPRLATGPLQRLEAAGDAANGVVVHDGTIYVLKGHHEAQSPTPTLLRSRDGGATFETNADELRDCSLEPWTKRCDYLVPHELAISDGRMFLEASGNLLVAKEGTTDWKLLIGSTSNGTPAAQICPLTHDRIGSRVLAGSECPLDIAWIGSGELNEELLEWVVPFSSRGAVTPALGNRMVQFIRHVGGDVVYSGVEGALLKSTDGGRSFRYVVYHPLDRTDATGYVVPPAMRRYPYIQQLMVSSRTPQLVIAGGFDKANEGAAYLAYSTNGGESWRDVSEVVPGRLVTLLVEDADGRILVGVTDEMEIAAKRLSLYEMTVELPGPRRRAVRK